MRTPTSRSSITTLASAAALTLALAGCGTGPSSGAIGSQGGTLQLQSGTALRVPAGALGEPTVVTLDENLTADGTEVVVSPAGLALARDAVLSWPDDGADQLVSSTGEVVSVSHGCGRGHVRMRHFGHFHRRGWAWGRDGGVHGGGGVEGMHHDAGAWDHGWVDDGGVCADDDDDDAEHDGGKEDRDHEHGFADGGFHAVCDGGSHVPRPVEFPGHHHDGGITEIPGGGRHDAGIN